MNRFWFSPRHFPLKKQIMINPVGIPSRLISMKPPAFLLIFWNDLGDSLMMVNLHANILKINIFQMSFTHERYSKNSNKRIHCWNVSDLDLNVMKLHGEKWIWIHFLFQYFEGVFQILSLPIVSSFKEQIMVYHGWWAYSLVSVKPPTLLQVFGNCFSNSFVMVNLYANIFKFNFRQELFT